MLCNTGSGDVQKSPIWSLRSVGGDVDEVEISTVSKTYCPPHSDIHISINKYREVVVGDVDNWRIWRNKTHCQLAFLPLVNLSSYSYIPDKG